MNVFLYVCIGTTCVSGTQGGQKWALDHMWILGTEQGYSGKTVTVPKF